VNDRPTINEGWNNTDEEIAVWVGLDWADRQHSIALYEVGSGKRESYTLKHTAEAFQDWVSGLRAQYGGRKVAVVLGAIPGWSAIRVDELRFHRALSGQPAVAGQLPKSISHKRCEE